MPTGPPQPQLPPQPERAGFSPPVLGSPRPVCIVCGAPREPSKREACSNKCRAALARQRQAEAQRARDQELLALLDQAEQHEARAAELRAQARQHLSAFRQ